MIVNHQYRFVYIHIPKTAGSSIRTALSALDGDDRQAVAKTRHEQPRHFLTGFEARTGRSAASLDGYRYIAFVRNPWDRFASLHRFLRTPKMAQRYPDVPEDLDRFAQMLDSPPEWMQRIHSLQPQVRYLWNCKPWVGRFETLQDDFARLCNILGVELSLPHLKKTAGTTVAPDMSTQSAEILARLYAKDIARFSYTPPAWAGIR